MSLGFASAEANLILDAMAGGTAYAGSATLYVKLHTADPGAAGTANAATETTRKAVTWGSASAGSKANSVALTWTNIAGSQTATHFSMWDNLTAGTFKGDGTVTANAYTAGDTFTVAIGALTATLNIAA
jgi:hypothetical protein